MAKIVRFYETGGPEVLRVEDDDPGAPGAGEVLLSIDAIGLNRGEAAFRGGHYIFKADFPARLGAEASARIAELGPGVTGWAVGQRVMTLPTFPIGSYGFYASEAIAPVSCLAPLPEGLEPDQSASIWVAFLTAYGGLVEAGGLKRGDAVVITAASSSVGLAALQIARDLGALPIATTRTRDKAEALLAAGAAHVVVTQEEDLAQAVTTLTGGKGASLAFDAVAGPFLQPLSQSLADNGALIVYGGLANAPAEFPRQLAIRKNLLIRGYNFFGLLADQERRQRAMNYILARIGDGVFSMPIAQRFKIDEVVLAHRELEKNAHVGKLILEP